MCICDYVVGLKEAKKELAETLEEYDEFKEYKARNAINK
jgi:hypothetical protein